MRPDDELINAWRKFLDTRKSAKMYRLKSEAMFRHSVSSTGVDVELYERATELRTRSTRMEAKAHVEFKKALCAGYSKRFRIQWANSDTCTVWVREFRNPLETPLQFNKSLRVKKVLALKVL